MCEMKCAVCGSENVEYYNPEAIKQRVIHTRYKDYSVYEKGVSYYCHHCALYMCYDFSYIFRECEKCGKEQEIELFLKDLDGRLFCCEECMFKFHNMKPIGD